MERNRHPHQETISKFTDYIQASPQSQTNKLYEEMDEVREAMDRTGLSHETALELTDLVIASVGLIHCAGLDFNQLFDEKMKISWEKYKNVPSYISEGLTQPEAQAKAKLLWEAKSWREPLDDGRFDSSGNLL